MNRILLAFSWFFSILFGRGAARIAQLEAAAAAAEAPIRREPPPPAAPAHVASAAPAPLSPPARQTSPAASAPSVASADTGAAIRLLTLLQAEARFVDFVMENIDGYTDAQVGAGVRAVHSGCRRIFKEKVALEPVLADSEGSTVQVPAGFDATAIRVVGSVVGAPPFYGTLQHHGWRVVTLSLPAGTTAGAPESRIIAPAEVEV